MKLLSAAEGWIIHFIREDNYKPLWQSRTLVNNNVNVLHISHNLEFTSLSLVAQWKDIDNKIQYMTQAKTASLFALP